MSFTKDTYTKKLLSTRNRKTQKGEKKGYKTYILYMSPFKQNSKNINLCPHATNGCASACLFKSGMGGIYTNVQQGRINKSEFYLNDRIGFLDYLIDEIGNIINKHKTNANYKNLIPVFRLNGTTDIRWEKQKASNGLSIMDSFPNYQFYDYTKNPYRFNENLPSNYHLTFSRSENNDNHCKTLLSKGYNVAYVFDKVPTEWNGYEVINGDETDLRFLDKKNVIVGLKFKKLTGKGTDNKAMIDDNDFIIQVGKEVKLLNSKKISVAA